MCQSALKNYNEWNKKIKIIECSFGLSVVMELEKVTVETSKKKAFHS
jgi:hypothetical protein